MVLEIKELALIGLAAMGGGGVVATLVGVARQLADSRDSGGTLIVGGLVSIVVAVFGSALVAG